MSGLRLTVPVGTRPEVIKLAPVVTALSAAGHQVRCIATGQHYDPAMYEEIFAGAGLRPDVIWRLSGTEGERLGQLLASAFQELAAQPADGILVLGDTYTAPLFAMAARRFGVGVIHLEAGLRSQNERSVEEVNRRMMVALATVHLAPTRGAADFLAAEGVPAERVRVVGNPVIDAIVSSGVGIRPLRERAGVLLTAHRATNVDSPERLRQLVDLINALGERHGPVLMPLHPRTRDRLEQAGWIDEVRSAPGVQVCEPMPYRELLTALSTSQVVVTDSGGLQEEAAFFGVPAVVMRHSTPRWEGIASGAAVLTGPDCGRALAAVQHLTSPAEQVRVAALPCPYGNGRSAEQICRALTDPSLRQLLTPQEPALIAAPPPPQPLRKRNREFARR
ncbi:MAG TPA: UDP-N-acetylglucosamine 2-epimerase (non-hydrolyzing) [Mycobacteriales bacterium]|nr:UDP-N-acetylglucosamine 2-epimerase (non-hydrolyzing) [Mycobacteriales bacterium]